MNATTTNTPLASEGGASAVPRLVVAAPSLDNPDLLTVIADYCALGPAVPASLVVACADRPETVAPILLEACRHLDLASAGPIDLMYMEEVTPVGPGELALFLGGDQAAANLATARGWLAARSPRPASPAQSWVTAVAAWSAPSGPADPRDLAEPARPARRHGPPPLAVALGHPDDVESRVDHLRRELGDDRQSVRRLGQPAGVDSYRRVAEVCAPLDWIDGYLSLSDAQFLYDVVAAVRPTRMIEIGSASGYSAAVALRALADAGVPLMAADGRPALLSFDIATHCYWDASRRVGSAAAELVPSLAHGVEFVTGTSVDAGRLPAASASLAFVDANHEHPWASLDVLLLARVLRPGSWIVLHDVRLSACAARYQEITGTAVQWDQRGAQYLYDHWPFERLIERVAPSTNIAAIRLPVDRTLSLHDIHDALAQPWQCHVPEPVLEAVRTLG